VCVCVCVCVCLCVCVCVFVLKQANTQPSLISVLIKRSLRTSKQGYTYAIRFEEDRMSISRIRLQELDYAKSRNGRDVQVATY